MTDTLVVPGVTGTSCRLIACVIIDSDKRDDLDLLKSLREELGVVRAYTSPCLSMLTEAKVKPGRLPDPVPARYVEILVSEAEADSVFEFVCEHARIDRLGGGAVIQMDAPFGSLYQLPEDIQDEPGG